MDTQSRSQDTQSRCQDTQSPRTLGLADFNVEEVLGNSTLLVRNKQRQRKVLKQLKCCVEINISETVERVKYLANTFSHSYITDVEDAFVVGSDNLYLLCQYCEGGSLHALIKRARHYQDVVNETEAIEWSIQMCLALHHLHERGYLYNFLCPKNVLLTNNCCKLDCTRLISRELNMKTTSTPVATPYSPPETLLRPPRELSESGDIWALGCSLYELCSLQRLFPRKEVEKELVEEIVNTKIPDFPDMFSQELANFWRSLMNRDPEERPSLACLLEIPFVVDHLKEMEANQRNDNDTVNSLPAEEGSKCDAVAESGRSLHFSTFRDDDPYEGDESDFLTAEDIDQLINPPGS